jgi:hypothetical protein
MSDAQQGAPTVDRRALALWPGLDRGALRRCRHDPDRIARLVARTTSLSVDVIRTMLIRPLISREDAETWFG